MSEVGPSGSTTPDSLERWLSLASTHGTPVFITVWDLLPPSRVGFLSRQLLGVGVFHTNIWIPDLQSEYAFGGHDAEGVTGVFALPTDDCVGDTEVAEDELAQADGRKIDKGKARATAESFIIDGISRRCTSAEKIPAPGQPPFPGARYLGAYFVGYAGASDDDDGAANAPAKILGGGRLVPGMNTHGRWAAAQTGTEAFKEPAIFLPPDVSSSSLTESHPHLVLPPNTRHPKRSGLRARSLAHALRVLSTLRASPEWHGTSYELLTRNCNHFAGAFLRELCGDNARLPNWINRAAWLGDGVQRLVPQSVLERAVFLIAGVDSTDAPGAGEDFDEVLKEQEHTGEETFGQEAVHNLQKEQHAGEIHRPS